MCQLDHVKFLLAPGLQWQMGFKNAELELQLLTDIDMLFYIVEKRIKGGICHS